MNLLLRKHSRVTEHTFIFSVVDSPVCTLYDLIENYYAISLLIKSTPISSIDISRKIQFDTIRLTEVNMWNVSCWVNWVHSEDIGYRLKFLRNQSFAEPVRLRGYSYLKLFIGLQGKTHPLESIVSSGYSLKANSWNWIPSVHYAESIFTCLLILFRGRIRISKDFYSEV